MGSRRGLASCMWGLGPDYLEVKLTLKRIEILRRVQVARRTGVCARSDQWGSVTIAGEPDTVDSEQGAGHV